MTRPNVLPSAICTASAPRIGIFRGSMAGLCAPLSTLRRNPRGQLRMTRGRCGSLLLHRKRLALSTPCRSPGASQMSSGLPLKADIAQYSRHVSNVPTSEVGQRHLAHRNDASRSYSAESNVPVQNANGAASKVELGASPTRLELDQHCRC